MLQQIGGNAAFLTIEGNLNIVDVDQTTMGNTATVMIDGMSNQSTIVQQ